MTAREEVLQTFEKRDCTVVVIGAMDGVTHDKLSPWITRNTRWDVMFVEPLPYYFRKLKENFGDRKNTRFFNGAIKRDIGMETMTCVSPDAIANGQAPYWCDGISTFHPDRNAMKDIGNEFKEEVDVITLPFSALKLKNIDILQIDAEGCDFEIFQQAWELEFYPKLIIIEVVSMSPDELTQLERMLTDGGYDYARDPDNSDDLVAIRRADPKAEYEKMPKVAFFIHDEWAFGSIHKALVKELYHHGVNATILNWNHDWEGEFKAFNRIFDAFVTISGRGVTMLVDRYSVPWEKIIAVSHGRYDVSCSVIEKHAFDRLKGYGVIGPDLADFSREAGIERVPLVVKNGVAFDDFYQTPATSLKQLGYGGELKHADEYNKVTDLKRGYLAQIICQHLDTDLRLLEKQSHLAMPDFYRTVDSIIVSSSEESSGLPLMEAASAGRLPLTTQVGVQNYIPNPAAIVLPTEEEYFVEAGIEKIKELQQDPRRFTKLCRESQDFARENYDWKHVLDDWLELLK